MQSGISAWATSGWRMGICAAAQSRIMFWTLAVIYSGQKTSRALGTPQSCRGSPDSAGFEELAQSALSMQSGS